MASKNKTRGTKARGTKGEKRPAARNRASTVRARAGALARMLATSLEIEPSAPDVTARARVRQIAILIRQTPLMAVISVLNAALLVVALWQTTPRPLLLGWLALTWTVWAAVMIRWRRQHRREPPLEVSRRTLRRAVLHSGIGGALWGLGAIALFPAVAPLQQLVLAFVIGGMGAGAVASMSAFPAACYAFILASATPLAFNFLRAGTTTSLVMGAMVLVYIVALIVVSRIGYRTFLEGVRTELENKRLLDRLSATHARLVDSIESVPAGIVFCDADDRLVVCNSRYREWMCPGRESEIIPGMRFDDLLEMSADAVLGPVHTARRRAWVRAGLKQHRNPRKPAEIVFADGRFVRVLQRRTEDGGTISVLTDITDLRQHEADIAAQSSLLTVTLESMAQGLVAFDKDLTILASNEHLATLLGMPATMLAVGSSLGDVIELSAKRGDYGPGKPARLAAKYKKLTKGGKAHTFERTLADGTVLEVHDAPLGDGGSVVTYTNITERKRAEEAVRLSEQKFRYLVEGSIQGIVITDKDMKLVFANQAAA
ncbi:MAG: PAS-domain containing protein, partial [Alphaproteobacteria bacterium]